MKHSEISSRIFSIFDIINSIIKFFFYIMDCGGIKEDVPFNDHPLDLSNLYSVVPVTSTSS